jgi:hypothetical protein
MGNTATRFLQLLLQLQKLEALKWLGRRLLTPWRQMQLRELYLGMLLQVVLLMRLLAQ